MSAIHYYEQFMDDTDLYHNDYDTMLDQDEYLKINDDFDYEEDEDAYEQYLKERDELCLSNLGMSNADFF